MIPRQTIPLALALAAVASLAGCSGSGGMGRVDLQLSTRASSGGMARAGGPQLSSVAGQTTISLGGDQIVLDRVELVLRKVKLEGTNGCAATAGSTDVESEDCGELDAGPTVFDLPLGEGAAQMFTASVPAGSYQRVRFQIHRPVDANGDATLLAEHPDLSGVSIRVTGSYQGAGDTEPTPFSYVTDLTSEVEVGLAQPVTLATGGELAVTLAIDLSGWFANAEGTGLVDPAQALDGQPLESLVEQHVRSSFHAFEDANQDGAED